MGIYGYEYEYEEAFSYFVYFVSVGCFNKLTQELLVVVRSGRGNVCWVEGACEG